MTIDEIQTLASVRTERIADNILDMDDEFIDVVQDFCSRARFHWRKKTFTFTTVAGTSEYDLSSSSYGDIDDLEQLINLRYVASATDVRDPMSEISDSDQQDRLLADTSTTDIPTAYFIKPGTFYTVHLSPIPKAAYSIRGSYWAIPQNAELTSRAVPLVPSLFHRVLAKGLERNIWRVKYGDNDGKFLKADADYEKGVAEAVAKANFGTRKERFFRNNTEEAVRST